jgi:hypothetical protein
MADAGGAVEAKGGGSGTGSRRPHTVSRAPGVLRRPCAAPILLALLISACAADRSPLPSPPPPLPPPVARLPAPADDALLDDRLCLGLVHAVEAAGTAFQALRLEGAGEGRWRARPLDGELDSCRVDGSGMLTATYACMPARPGHGDPGSTEALYRRIEGRIDRCLARASWYPRRWAKAPEVTLAAGERQILWRDQAAWPRPALRLKVEQDYDRPGGWLLRFTAYMMR